MKKLIWFGLSLAALSATPTFATLTHELPSYADTTKTLSAPPLEALEEIFKECYNELFARALNDSKGLGSLYQAYINADACLKADMDKHLLGPILQSLQSDDAPQTLIKLSPFFQNFLPRTQYKRGALRASLRGVLTRELEKVKIPYHHIKHPTAESLEKGEKMLLSDSCHNSHTQKVRKVIRKERHAQLKNKAKEHLTTLKSQCNHAYINSQVEQEKMDQLAAIYKHLSWSKKRTFKTILRKSRDAKMLALKNQIKGLIRMAK